MGRKWFLAVKKVFGSESKEKHNGEKPKKKWGRSKDSGKIASNSVDDSAVTTSPPPLSTSPPPKQNPEGAGSQTQHAFSVAMATVVAAEAAAAAARAATEVVRLTTTSFRVGDGRSREEAAAIKIQAAFRGYLARRGTGAMRGLVRLKILTNSNSVKRQTAKTLHSMQTLARIQSQVRERKITLSEENQVLHKQRQIKHEKEFKKSKVGEDWVDSPQSKEQFEAKLQKKQDAALRREKALAYAYTHQWRSNSARPKNSAFLDPTNPQWGWSWLERWMAARPWESNRSIADRDRHSDLSSMKSDCRSITGDPTKASSRRLSRPPSVPPLSTPPSVVSNDDSRSLLGFKFEQHKRRHSIGASFSIRDNESFASLPARAKSRFQESPAGKSKANGGGLTAKQLSPPVGGEGKKPMPSPAATRRLSGPPMLACYGKKRQCL